MDKQALLDKYFAGDIKQRADFLVSKYEGNRRAPLLEVLHLMMAEHSFITIEIEQAVAAYLDLPPIQIREVVTFYTLYYTQPRAKTRFNVCRTLSCALRGANDIIKHMENKLGIKAGQVAEDGSCGLQAVECLGACEIAPMLQLNDDDYIGDLTIEKVDQLMAAKGVSS